MGTKDATRRDAETNVTLLLNADGCWDAIVDCCQDIYWFMYILMTFADKPLLFFFFFLRWLGAF